MKLREFDFNSIKQRRVDGGFTNLAVRMENGQWYEELTIGLTLESLPKEFAEAEIKETRWFFDTFVIELKEDK